MTGGLAPVGLVTTTLSLTVSAVSCPLQMPVVAPVAAGAEVTKFTKSSLLKKNTIFNTFLFKILKRYKIHCFGFVMGKLKQLP
jgi:hypothetical protein